MPEPIYRHHVHTPSFQYQLSSISFNLRRSSQYIHDGVEYKFDYEEYESRTSRGRMFHHQAQNEYDNGIITKQELDEITNLYFNDICTYYLIDEDGKECGKFNTISREYSIFYKRILLNRQIYYINSDREVTTYGGSRVGILSEDCTQII